MLLLFRVKRKRKRGRRESSMSISRTQMHSKHKRRKEQKRTFSQGKVLREIIEEINLKEVLEREETAPRKQNRKRNCNLEE